MNKIRLKLLTIAFILFAFAQVAPAQTTAFTYQGRLSDSSMQANGTYDLGFALFDAASGGTQIGTAQTRAAVNVTNGIFTVQLDFGAAAFPGAIRFLEIAVKRPTDANFTTLAPRQPVTSTPYAMRALNAAAADTAVNSAQLGGAAANQFVQTTDTRLADARTPTAGSTNYIQNGTTQQASSSFNISGSGTAGGRLSGFQVNSATDFTVGANGKLRIDAGRNILIGTLHPNFGGDEPSVGGGNNSYFGYSTGGIGFTDSTTTGLDTTGSNNTLVGANASMAVNGLNYATAIGAGARVRDSNAVVLGRDTGQDAVIANGKITARNGIMSFGLVDAQGGIFAVGRVQASGGVALDDSDLRLRAPDDDAHRIRYNAGINGMEFQAFDDFRWSNRRNNRINMQLYSNGNLTIQGEYRQFSDARLKNDVQTFTGALDTVRRLRGVTFKWKPELNKGSDKHIGFIAQEVEAVLPEIVQTDKEGYKTVAYSSAVPVLVEAVKEQQTQIETQNRQIERQQRQIDELKSIVCALKPDAAVCKIEDK